MEKEAPVVGESTVNLVLPDAPRSAPNSPDYFVQRFGPTGECLNPDWPRITTEASESSFKPRKKGLRVLLINAPIREWSYPNIMPIGQGYVGAVAAMDGHHVDVLDLNAERRRPVKDSAEAFSKWIEDQVVRKLEALKPDVIGLGGDHHPVWSDQEDRTAL